MNYATLYQEFKLKKQMQQSMEDEELHKIKALSSTKKLNQYSSYLLNSKLLEQLSRYSDQEVINLQSSIPILYKVGVLQHLDSIESAKQKMEESQMEHTRMKWEARFIYCLWKMIDEEQIQTRELKEIIYNLHDKRTAELKKILEETYKQHESVCQFIETWRILRMDQQYYKSFEKKDSHKSNCTQEVSSSTKQVHKIGMKDGSASQTAQKNQKRIKKCDNQAVKAAFLRDRDQNAANIASKAKEKKQTETSAQDSAEKEIQNQRQIYLDRQKQKQLVGRLYNNEKYRLREERRKQAQDNKIKEELTQCTFKPELIDDRLKRSCSKTRSRSINGYEKAVNRMKVGIEKHKIEKEKRQHLPKGENYQKIRQQCINPPKFLQRKKQEEIVLFLIEFDLGRHKIKIKVHQNDTADSIARNLCKNLLLKT